MNFTNCIINGNRAGQDGDGIGRDGGGIHMVSGSSLALQNVNVTDNEADNWGGGIFSWESVVTMEGRVNQILPATSSNASRTLVSVDLSDWYDIDLSLELSNRSFSSNQKFCKSIRSRRISGP